MCVCVLRRFVRVFCRPRDPPGVVVQSSSSKDSADICVDEGAGDARHLLCPAAVTVAHLKKYVRLKFALDHQLHVSHTQLRSAVLLKMRSSLLSLLRS